LRFGLRDDEYQYGYETVYVTVKRPKHFYFYVKDHLGSTRAVVDEAGDVVEAYDYYPFGLQSRSYKEKGDPLTKETFTGKEQDTESNLHYFGARYYDAGAGRFLSRDRFSEKYSNLNPYHYTANNPMRFIDVNGDTLALVGEDKDKALKDLQEAAGEDGKYLSYDSNGNLVISDKYKGNNKVMNALRGIINSKKKFGYGVTKVPFKEGSHGVQHRHSNRRHAERKNNKAEDINDEKSPVKDQGFAGLVLVSENYTYQEPWHGQDIRGEVIMHELVEAFLINVGSSGEVYYYPGGTDVVGNAGAHNITNTLFWGGNDKPGENVVPVQRTP
jgi:RHS repeat-associated protein